MLIKPSSNRKWQASTTKKIIMIIISGFSCRRGGGDFPLGQSDLLKVLVGAIGVDTF